MMKNKVFNSLTRGVTLLGTIILAHTSAAAFDFSLAGKLRLVEESLNSGGPAVLLAVAAGLIVLGSALRRKLTIQVAQEQTQRAFTEAKLQSVSSPESITRPDEVPTEDAASAVQ